HVLNQKVGQVLHVYISRSEHIRSLSPKVDNVTPRFDSRARIEGGVAERMSMQIDDHLPPSRAVYLLRFILRPSSITSSYSCSSSQRARWPSLNSTIMPARTRACTTAGSETVSSSAFARTETRASGVPAKT